MSLNPFNHEQRYYREKIGVTTVVSTNSSTSSASGSLTPGRYRIISDTACWIRQTTTGGSATSSSALLPANLPIYANVDTETPAGGVSGNWGNTVENDDVFAALNVSGNGKLYITKVSDLWD